MQFEELDREGTRIASMEQIKSYIASRVLRCGNSPSLQNGRQRGFPRDIACGMLEARFGIGAYSLAEAGALLNVSPTTIRRWLFGYHYDHHGPLTQQMPLWTPQYGIDQEEPLLGFRDLMEARIVRGLRLMGIGLPTIRECLKRASEFVDDSHPFSTKQFRTDGKRLFLEQSNGFGDASLLDLKARQNVFKQVVEPTFKDLEYGAEAAARWWLIPNRRTIVIDPDRSFGQPIAVENGVATARLAQAVKAEESMLSATNSAGAI